METYVFYRNVNNQFLGKCTLRDSGDFTSYDQATKYAEFLSTVFGGEEIAFRCVDQPKETLETMEVDSQSVS